MHLSVHEVRNSLASTLSNGDVQAQATLELSYELPVDRLRCPSEASGGRDWVLAGYIPYALLDLVFDSLLYITSFA